jgi:multidrug efflux pump subunit AcrA (membrane-fusion protein)
MTEPTSLAEQLAAATARADQAEQHAERLQARLNATEWDAQARLIEAQRKQLDAAIVRAEKTEAALAAGVPLICADERHAAKVASLEARIAAVRDQIAYRIRAELVCCHIYGQVNDGVSEEEAERRFKERKRDIARHDLCYWGEASAGIAESGALDGPADTPAAEEEPHVCKPGATTYYCPTAGKVESSCHGGFDVCCNAPELHQPRDHRSL